MGNPFKSVKKFVKRTVKNMGDVAKGDLRDLGNLNLEGLFNRRIENFAGSLDRLKLLYKEGFGKEGKPFDKKAAIDSLLKATNKDEELDTQSRGEISSLLASGNYEGAKSLFSQAREATDIKFKSRRATDEMHKTLLDMPGTQQTRAEAFSNAFRR